MTTIRESENQLKIEKEQIESIMIQQGHKINLLTKTEAWQILENVILYAKKQAELTRRKENRSQPTREKMLYWNGFTDGLQEAIDQVYNVITKANEVVENKNRASNWQEDD